MNNGDMPAMPQSATGEGHACNYYDYGGPGVPTGLTKREMMAMHAPEVPDWFWAWWREEYIDNDFYFGSSAAPLQAGLERSRTITRDGAQALYFAWRAHYADALLAELERTKSS